MEVKLKDVFSDLKKLSTTVLEESNIVLHKGDVLTQIPNAIFDRYVIIEKSNDEEQRKKREDKLVSTINLHYGMDKSIWTPLNDYLKSLNTIQLGRLNKEIKEKQVINTLSRNNLNSSYDIAMLVGLPQFEIEPILDVLLEKDNIRELQKMNDNGQNISFYYLGSNQ